jgi:farnesol dehydrogenase
MERYFITGSTGFIGMELAKRLQNEGKSLHLLVRSLEKARGLQNPGTTIFQGDLTDSAAVSKAMYGCTHVFHLAAFAKPFASDPSVFIAINLDGTRHVLDAALKHGVKKVVFTSTAGTFGITSENEDADETSEKPTEYFTDYARTKRQAELLCNEYLKKGLSVVTLYPTRVFGPGIVNESNAVTKMLDLYQKGKWRIIPGNGKTFGNYVYVGDVVNGHIQAMEKGKSGEGYILGGENVTFDGLFRAMGEATGKKHVLFKIPYPILWFAALLLVGVAKLTGKPPLITPDWVRRYLQHRRLSAQKSINEIDYTITPLVKGFNITSSWLRNET